MLVEKEISRFQRILERLKSPVIRITHRVQIAWK